MTHSSMPPGTKVKQAEKALRDGDNRYRDFANAASEWFWEMGPDLRFTYISDRYYAITGFRPDDKISAWSRSS